MNMDCLDDIKFCTMVDILKIQPLIGYACVIKLW